MTSESPHASENPNASEDPVTSIDPIRRLTAEGVAVFRRYLARLRADAAEPPPMHLLTDARASRAVQGARTVARRAFESRLAAARYLDTALAGIDADELESGVGLWSWLSLYYFDQVCPPLASGRRRPGSDYRHILRPDYRHGHRHLLAGAYLVYSVFGLGEALSRLLLGNRVDRENNFVKELAGRQSFITNRGIITAAHQLYYNPRTGRPKRGALSKKNAPGTLPRFIHVIQQLDLNYDLYSMTGPEIVSLLPPEFDGWKS
ncbi:MAG: hypothetical protein P8010_15880 [Desulfosarcinaceae bacterium]|jgi:hypothetical protein